MTLRFFYLLFVICFSFCSEQKAVVGDMMISNGLIIDGSGEEAYKSDLIIDDGNIIWIGNKEKIIVKVDTILDAGGLVVSPGFIDIHAHGDPFETPDFENFLSMGVTCIALGMDGSSQKVSNLGDWMLKVEALDLGVNVIPFVGHGTVRLESGIGHSKNIEKNQLQNMTDLVDSALASGCWGLSMGLEYTPGIYANTVELEALARAVGKYNGMITSHIRSEDNDAVDDALEEMVALAKYCNVNISHLKVVYGKGRTRAQEIIQLLQNKQNVQFEVTADFYPYNASYTGIGIVFPQWAKVPKKYKSIKEERGEELLSYLKNKIAQRNGPEATLFGTGPYAGKTLQDLVEEYNLPYEVILRDIIGPYGASAAYFIMNKELQDVLISSSNVMVGSDGSPTMRHPRGHGTFAKIIEEFVVRDSILLLEEAIYKMSGLPAKTLGMKNRGTIELGKIADILIFDPSNIRNKATFKEPHVKASGFNYVLMDGEVVRHGEITVGYHGGLLKRVTVN